MVGVLRVSFDGVAVGNSFTGASTSLSRKSDTSDRRKRFPDVHASTVFMFLVSGLRILNVVMILEASGDSPRDFQGRLPKEG